MCGAHTIAHSTPTITHTIANKYTYNCSIPLQNIFTDYVLNKIPLGLTWTHTAVTSCDAVDLPIPPAESAGCHRGGQKIFVLGKVYFFRGFVLSFSRIQFVKSCNKHPMPRWLFSLKREMVRACKNMQSEEAAVQASTWQHVPSGDTKAVVWLWSFRFVLPHLSLQHLFPEWCLAVTRNELCGGEVSVSLCPFSLCQVSYWLLGFSVFGKLGSFWWWLPLAGHCCWNTGSPSTSATKTSFSCMFLPHLLIIKAEQPIRASA